MYTVFDVCSVTSNVSVRYKKTDTHTVCSKFFVLGSSVIQKRKRINSNNMPTRVFWQRKKDKGEKKVQNKIRGESEWEKVIPE